MERLRAGCNSMAEALGVAPPVEEGGDGEGEEEVRREMLVSMHGGSEALGGGEEPAVAGERRRG
jgi:hypothetical protein